MTSERVSRMVGRHTPPTFTLDNPSPRLDYSPDCHGSPVARGSGKRVAALMSKRRRSREGGEERK